MSVPVLHTKVILPQRRKDLLSRKRLLELMNELLDEKLVLVTAPAGYGKTSLLIDIAYQHEFPFCWYELDVQDQDLIRFVAHFIASITQKFPGFGDQSKAALQSMSLGNLPVEQLVALVVEEIYQVIHEHFVIVLDDYHLVSDSRPVNIFVNRFAQNASENCHLVIVSRSLLPLEDLPLMVARLEAGGLGNRELAFQSEEIQALMLQNYQQVISSAAADDLVEKTEGWITGLLLSAQTMWRGMTDRMRAAEVTGVGLYDFLANQVLNQQPSDLRDFLLRSSLLEEFDAKTCERILGQPPQGSTWQDMMRQALRFNLFIVPVGESGTWLRYHHLFQEFLQAQLATEQPEEKDRILRGMAKEFENQEEWAKAHALYQQLQDFEADARLLIHAGEALSKSGRLSLLAKWLDELPADIFFSHPILLARRGMVVATLGNSEFGLSLLDQAMTALSAESNRSHLAQALIWRAMVHRMRGSFTESLDDIHASFSLTENQADLASLRAEAFRIQGQNIRKLGKLSQAIVVFSDSLAVFQTIQDKQGVARLSLELGAAYLELGDYEMALTYYHNAPAYFEAEHNYYALSSSLNDLGVIYYLRGEYLKASEYLENALNQAKRGGNIRVEALAMTSLGDLYKVLDSPQAAEEAYREAREIVVRIHDSALLIYLDLANVSIALGRGQLSLARQSLESAEMYIQQGGEDYTHGLYVYEAGHLALVEQKPIEAISLLDRAKKIFKSGGQAIEGGCTCLLLARAHFEAGNSKAASTFLHEALRSVAHLKNPHSLVVTARETLNMLKTLVELPEAKSEATQMLEKIDRLEREIPATQRLLRKQRISVPLEPSQLQIQALGIAQVTMGGRKVTSADWQTQKTRELFFLLLTDRKGWTKEGLGEILWPDSSPAQLKLRFKNTLYRLRHALEQEVIVFDGERYAFNWDLDYEYDVENFYDLLRQAEISTGNNEKKRIYRKAIQLYQGEFLPEISMTWVVPERERLNQFFINACMQYAEICLGESDIESTLDLCQRVFANDPYLEKAHRLAMLAYAASGNQAAIVRQFHQLKHELKTGLNAKPSSETVELYNMLKR